MQTLNHLLTPSPRIHATPVVIQDIRGMNDCKFRNSVCHKCSQKGHIVSVCNSSKNVHIVTDSPNEELFRISFTTKDNMFVTMNIEGTDVSMQVDTDCGVSIVPYSVYTDFSDNVTLETCNTRLMIIVNINQNISVLGRNWLHLFQLNWPALRKSYNVNYVNTSPYENLFDGSLGCYTGDPIKLTVDSDPTFHRAWKVP